MGERNMLPKAIATVKKHAFSDASREKGLTSSVHPIYVVDGTSFSDQSWTASRMMLKEPLGERSWVAFRIHAV